MPSPHAALLGRWRYLRRLSRPDAACVLLVADARLGGRRAALKIFPAPDDAALESAGREFRTLRQVRHPGIAEVRDFGVLDLGASERRALEEDPHGRDFLAALPSAARLAYITFEHFDGLDLETAFRELLAPFSRAPTPATARQREPRGAGRGSPPAIDDPVGLAARWRVLLAALARVCEALDHVHARGLVHYDVKPQNILFAARDRDDFAAGFDVKVIDFGLCELETTPLGPRARGSVPFIAPEVLRGAGADRRSDLFSLGASIASTILGRSPFEGNDPAAWLTAARAGEIVDLERSPWPLPDGLVALLTRLLSPDPASRPRDALAVIAELERIGGFEHASADIAPLREVPTIGLERELNFVRDEIEQLRRDDSVTALFVVETSPGQFTERFVSELRVLARSETGDFATGACVVPRCEAYQPFGELVREIASRLDLDAPRWEPFRETLRFFLATDDGSAARDEAVAVDTSPPRFDATTFDDRLTEFFLEAAHERPLVLCIRDLQIASAATLRVFRSLVRNLAIDRRREASETARRHRPSRLLLVATVDELDAELDDVEGTPSKQALLDATVESECTRRLRLRDLPMDRLKEWIAARAPELAPSSRLLQRIFERSDGAPRFLDELVRRLLADVGSKRPVPTSTRRATADDGEDDGADPTLRFPQSLVEAILERLPPDAGRERDSLELLAAADRAGLDARTLSRALALLAAPGGEATSSREATIDPPLRALAAEGLVELRERGAAITALWSCEPARRQFWSDLGPRRRRALHAALAAATRASRDAGAEPRSSVPTDICHHALRAGMRDDFLREALVAADRLLRHGTPDDAARLYEQVLAEMSDDPRGDPSGEPGTIDRARTARLWEISSRLVDAYRERRETARALEKLTVLLSLDDGERRPTRLARVYRQMGEVYDESGEATSAAHFYEKSLQTLGAAPVADHAPCDERAERRTELVRTLLSFAGYLWRRNELGTAVARLDECREAASGDPTLVTALAEACLLQARVHSQRNEHARGIELTEQALEIATRVDSVELTVRAIRTLCESHQARGDHDRATECIRRGIELAERHGIKTEVAECYNSLGTVQYSSGDHHRALESYERCLLLGRQLGDDKQIATSYNNLGNVCRFREETERATNYYRLAIEIFSRLDLQSNLATCMNNLAGVLEREGHFNEALDYAFRALERRKQSIRPRRIAFSYYRIGMIYQSKGDVAKAVSYAQRSLEIRKELDAKVDVAFSHLQLAELRLSLGDLAGAFTHCDEGSRTFEDIDNHTGELMAREIRARLLIQVGELEEAERTLEEVIENARTQELQVVVGGAALQLGLLRLEVGQLTQAERRLVEAEKTFRTTGIRRRLVESLLALAALHLEIGNAERAEGHLEEAYSLLEKLGIRDLAPTYFLLRGQLAIERSGGDVDEAEKLLERGLSEARESQLQDLQWRFQSALGQLAQRRGDHRLARIHFQEARDVLDAICGALAPEYRRNFYVLRHRAIVVRLCGQVVEPERARAPDARAAPETTAPSTEDPAAERRLPPAVPLEDPAATAAVHQTLLRLQEIITARGSETTSLESLLERILDAVISLTSAERGFVLLRDPRSRGGRLLAARNFDREEIESPREKYSASVAERVMETGEPLLAGDALSEASFDTMQSIRDLRLRSILCVPLVLGSEVLGVIYVDNRHRRHAFQQSELKTLQTFTDQAAIAITTARLLDAKEHSNIKLRNQVHKRTVQLVVAQKALADRQTLLESRYGFESLVGRSEAMQRVFHLIRRVCASRLPVLIEGESGTGKDLIARAVHFNSDMRKGPFVSENCGALNESLLESELFGHTRDAFSGAVSAHKGIVEQASGGTLFLDAVADMSTSMQQRLLRVLQEGEVRPVGGERAVRVDVRVISAAKRPLAESVAEGSFRADLYYRLNGVTIHVPPLRERPEDIPELVRHFAREVAERGGTSPPRFSAGAIRRLMAHAWPGNVRELRHLVERSALIARSGKIREEDLAFDPSPAPAVGSRDESANGAAKVTFRDARDVFERRYVESTLERVGGNVRAAAAIAGLSRESMYRLLKKHGISWRD